MIHWAHGTRALVGKCVTVRIICPDQRPLRLRNGEYSNVVVVRQHRRVGEFLRGVAPRLHHGSHRPRDVPRMDATHHQHRRAVAHVAENALRQIRLVGIVFRFTAV